MEGETAHLTAQTIEQLAEGNLAAAEERGARKHIIECVHCAMELEAFESLFARLGDLPRFAPSPVFADAVMARVRINPEESFALAWLRRFLPTTRRGWVLLGSATLAPALPIFALVLLLLTQPLLSLTTLWQWGTLRLQSLAQASFAWLFDAGINSGLYGMAESGFSTVLSFPVLILYSAVLVLGFAIPLSGWGLLRLTRAPMASVNHAN